MAGWTIGKYLGAGGYGKVYEIERTLSGVRERAALKVVSRPADDAEIEACYENGYDQASMKASYEEEIQRYVKEYELMKDLQGQTNIVSCDDFAVVPRKDGIGGQIFIRMELLTPLQKATMPTKQSMLSESEVIRLGKDICKALILCEARHIIHRDIKPENILISKFGDYKLGDFGVAGAGPYDERNEDGGRTAMRLRSRARTEVWKRGGHLFPWYHALLAAE